MKLIILSINDAVDDTSKFCIIGIQINNVCFGLTIDGCWK